MEEKTEVKLQKLKRTVSAYLSKDCLQGVMADIFFDEALEEWKFEASGYITAQALEKLSYPRDWWQAFKDRWFPYWLKRRYPVKNKLLDVYALYPSIALPEKFATVAVFDHYPDELVVWK